MAQIELGPPISTRDGFTVQIVDFDVGSRRGYNVELIEQSSGQPSVKRGIPDENGLITVQNLEPGETTKIRVTLSGDSGTSVAGTPLPGDALVPELGPFEPTADGCKVRIKNMDNGWQFVPKVNNLEVELRMGVVVVKDKQHGQPITVTVTSKKLGHADGTSSVSGFASPLVPTFAPPIPTNTTGFTVQITNYDASYTWTPTATSGNVVISNTGLITVTNLVGGGTLSTVTVTTSKGVAPDAYAQGSVGVVGESMNLTKRWIHVGLLAPLPDPSSNNNLQREKYKLDTWQGNTDFYAYPKYEVSYISHLKPNEMKQALATYRGQSACYGSKNAMLVGDETLNSNELMHTIGKDSETDFTFYWSQQENRQIVDSMSSTHIKMNGQNDTQFDLAPNQMLDILFNEDTHEKICFWGQSNNPRELNLLTAADGYMKFIPRPDQKLPKPPPGSVVAPLKWKLKQALQSGSFSGRIEIEDDNGKTKAFGSSIALQKGTAWYPAINPHNQSTTGEYAIDIEVTIMLEYKIIGYVKTYKDLAVDSKTGGRPPIKLPKPLTTTEYELTKRVPLSMLLPYKMTRKFPATATPPRSLQDCRTNLDASTYSLTPVINNRSSNSMQAFKTKTLNSIPLRIQQDIDRFLVQGPFYYDPHPKRIEHYTGLSEVPINSYQIDWEYIYSYLGESRIPRPAPTTKKKSGEVAEEETKPIPVMNKEEQLKAMGDLKRALVPYPILDDRCYYTYTTYNIDLNSIQAATSDIFISGIKVGHVLHYGGTTTLSPVTISFYNDLDADLGENSMRAPSTALNLQLGVIDELTGEIQANDLIPQFQGLSFEHKSVTGTHNLMGGHGTGGDLSFEPKPIAGWVKKNVGS